MKRLMIILCALLMMLLAAPVEASVVDDLVIGFNLLEDDNWERLVNDGETINTVSRVNTTLDVDDYLAGMARITALYSDPGKVNQLASYPAGGETFSAIFLLKATSKSTDGTNFVYSFSGATIAEWTAVGMPIIPDNDGVAAILYDDPDNVDPNAPDGDFNTNIFEALSTVDGTKLWEFETVVWGAQAAGDDIGSIPGFGTFGLFNGAVDVVEYFAGPQLVPTVYTPGVTSDAFVTGTIEPTTAGDFDAGSDFDLLLTTVPEPISLLTWGGLTGIGLAVAARRRKKRS